MVVIVANPRLVTDEREGALPADRPAQLLNESADIKVIRPLLLVCQDRTTGYLAPPGVQHPTPVGGACGTRCGAVTMVDGGSCVDRLRECGGDYVAGAIKHGSERSDNDVVLRRLDSGVRPGRGDGLGGQHR